MNAQQILDFIQAGHAIGTLMNHNSGNRYTFKFSRPVENKKNPNPGRPIWVHVLVGPDNENDYKYLGTVWPNHADGWRVHLGGKSYWRQDDQVTTVVDWFFYRLTIHRSLPEGVEFKHAGKCGRCGRTLTTPESIETGLGPVCAEKTNGS